MHIELDTMSVQGTYGIGHHRAKKYNEFIKKFTEQ